MAEGGKKARAILTFLTIKKVAVDFWSSGEGKIC